MPVGDRLRPSRRRASLGVRVLALAGILSCASTDRPNTRAAAPTQPTRSAATQASVSQTPSGPSTQTQTRGARAGEFNLAPIARLEEQDTEYPWGVVHSPITEGIVARLRQLEAEHPDLRRDRFIKVGDSMTRSPKFLACLADSTPPADPALRATLDALRASGIDLFRRESLSAENGWSAWQPLAGNPPPLLRELAAVGGRFALVMLGTNDIETSRVTTFARRWMRLIDSLLKRGVIPLVSTIPERRDRLESRIKVPRFNAAIRAIAQDRQVPLVDLHQALSGLPGEGLTSDGIHPSVLRVRGLVEACDFGPRGLQHGFNVRNLVSLEALHRARSALEGDWVEPAPISKHNALPSVRRLALKDADSPSAAMSFELTETTRVEVLALSAARAQPLGITLCSEGDRVPCKRAAQGFLRTLPLPKGNYSLVVSGPAGRALVALLRGRSGGS